jgi:hypothetical protein
VIVPCAPWQPDQPDLTDNGSGTVLNVLPRTATSYGPFPSLAALGSITALDSRVQGAYALQDSSGNTNIFAATAAKIWRLSGGATFNDVSGTTYSTGSAERWSGTLYGNRVIFSNYADPIQSFVIGSSAAFGNLSGSAYVPKARDVAVINNTLFCGNVFDSSGAATQRVSWSAQGDPTSWPQPGTSAALAAQSGFIDLAGDNGWVMGLVTGLGACDGAVFQERAVVRITKVGGDVMYNFTVAEGARGTPAPGSIAQLGGEVFYLGQDGFYVFDGAQSRPVGAQRVDKFFYGDVDQGKMDRISATIDPINKLYLCAYCASGAANPNRIIAYNWSVDRWSVTEADDVTVEILFRALTTGYTLEQLAAISSSLDALPASLDSRAWTGGKLILAGFDANHRMGYFSGPALAPTVDTSESQLTPNRLSRVTGVYPLTDGGTPSISIGYRNRQQDAVTYTDPVAMDANGFCPTNVTAKYHTGTAHPAGGIVLQPYRRGVGEPGERRSDGGALNGPARRLRRIPPELGTGSARYVPRRSVAAGRLGGEYRSADGDAVLAGRGDTGQLAERARCRRVAAKRRLHGRLEKHGLGHARGGRRHPWHCPGSESSTRSGARHERSGENAAGGRAGIYFGCFSRFSARHHGF